ncbi:histidine phosphatase family protein [Dactylosporangium sp. AC04546]|uniref:histidine phosphatase family protein n=1 Tax=Dactylosporangium sp. AC04546 TaxID=2862460 RepID=UPI001EE0E6B3|nr:histidine phosphatase family protein [Dactylosporangium sp. AC04546]WVK80371.1 histidine phosphatase family protein [Dactylosporangium sp. AC04546]
MTTLLLLRHGRTTTNATGILAGHQPVGLDEVGRAQAVAVGERLAAAKLPLKAVVSSPLPRCVETLSLALPTWEGVQIDDGIVECRYGDWTGRPLKELAKEPLWATVQAHPSAAVFPGAEGESMAAMSARAIATVRGWDARVAAEHGPEAVWLACSHGDIIKAVVADALGMHLDLFQRIAVEPASVTVIRYTPLRSFVLRLNDTGGDLSGFQPPPPSEEPPSSDAAVGGGSGGSV